jgi:hypothetical protein
MKQRFFIFLFFCFFNFIPIQVFNTKLKKIVAFFFMFELINELCVYKEVKKINQSSFINYSLEKYLIKRQKSSIFAFLYPIFKKRDELDFCEENDKFFSLKIKDFILNKYKMYRVENLLKVENKKLKKMEELILMEEQFLRTKIEQAMSIVYCSKQAMSIKDDYMQNERFYDEIYIKYLKKINKQRNEIFKEIKIGKEKNNYILEFYCLEKILKDIKNPIICIKNKLIKNKLIKISSIIEKCEKDYFSNFKILLEEYLEEKLAVFEKLYELMG